MPDDRKAPQSAARGTVQKFKDARGRVYWRARITYPDGERLWLKPRFDKEERAREYADEKSREAERREITVAKEAPKAKKSTGETCDDWHDRYLAFCVEQGLTTTEDKRLRWKKWISPHVGDKCMTAVTRDDIEDVRDALDEVVRAYKREGAGKERLAPKTAQNVWNEITVSFGEACSSKRRDLRVIETDPTNGVQPPERGTSPSKCYPFPSEAYAVFDCVDIALDWRELHAISAYTYARPGELRALEWADVDLDDRTIRITKAWDVKNDRVKGTKTGETRTIPIEPHLVPLLERMKKRASNKGPVLPVLATANDNKLAIIMREHFDRAGCKRARLTARSAHELRLRFRSWRDAGITWSIVRGDDVVKVQRRAGHRLIATTMRYVVEAENRGASFGLPLGPLPDSLLDPSKPSSKKTRPIHDPAKNKPVDGSGRRDLKTTTQATPEPFRAEIVAGEPSKGQRSGDDNPAIAGRLDSDLDAISRGVDAVEDALAEAIRAATAAGRFDVVGELARQIEARRIARAGGNVVALATKRGR